MITNSRWLAYATAGAASAFGSAQSAEGTIHYSGLINQKIGGTTATFPLDPLGGALAFRHQAYYNSSNYAGGSAFFNVFALAGGSCRGGFVLCPYTHVASALPLSPGQAASRGPFVPDGGLLAGFHTNHSLCGWGERGQFRRGAGFIGFKFNNGSGDQYGWARIRSQGPPSNKFILIDYAYGDIGDRVRAGQKSNSDTPALESLGGLALGAAGLIALRKQRALVAQPE